MIWFKFFDALVPIMDKHVNWFWVSCFPGLLYCRLSVYGVGLCHLLASYERYILICRPTEKDTVLSNRNRVKMYAIVTITIAASCLGCLTWSKDMSLEVSKFIFRLSHFNLWMFLLSAYDSIMAAKNAKRSFLLPLGWFARFIAIVFDHICYLYTCREILAK